MSTPLIAQASIKFSLPSEELRIGLLDDESGQIDWSQFIIAVSSVLLGDQDVGGPFCEQGPLSAYAPWVRDIGSQVAEQVRQAMDLGPKNNDKIALNIGVKPIQKNLFWLHVMIKPVDVPPGQTSLFDVQDASRRNWLVVPSNLLYHHTRSVISAGREGLFHAREGERWPSHQVERKNFRADMVMQPDSRLALQQENYGELFTRMQSHIDKMDDLSADVFDILSAKWIQSGPKSPTEMVTLTADDFLAMRGLKPNISGEGHRGGYKDAQREEIAARIASLDQLWVNVQEMSSTVLENGRRRRRKIRMQTKAVVVTMRMGEMAGEEIDPFAWRIRPGDGFAEFLLSDVGRETALMALRALEYNPERQYMEKRLTRYFSTQWRIRRKRADCLKPYRVETLLDAVNEAPDLRRAAHQREHFEKALDTLQRDGVIARWQYAKDCHEDELSGQGWIHKWIQWGVIVEPREAILDHYETIKQPNETREQQRIAPTVEASLGSTVKETRMRAGLSQTELARQLGINRSGLSQIEGLHRAPSAEVEAKLRDWLLKTKKA